MITKEKAISLIKTNVVLVIAIVLAVITCFIVPIGKEYFNYFDTDTLIALFCMLIVVAGLKSTNIFQLISKKLISKVHTIRGVIFVLVFGTFLFDMIVANDMSLIIFLPLTYIVLNSTGNNKYLAITFILQTIAANMGGMITPYGNPQNLYLYSHFNIETLEFFGILCFQFFTTAILLFICCSFISNKPLTLKNDDKIDIVKNKLIIYVILFILTVATIFRFIPCLLTFIIIILLVFVTDRKTFKKIDYGLLLTFCMFFVFSGNIARIQTVQEFMINIVNKNTLLAGIVSCQFISNVPTAIFLSKFTSNYRELLTAVNIGSLGIIISSLASLITLKEYLKHEPKNFLKYISMFTIINTIFLLILIIVTVYVGNVNGYK